MNCSYVCIEELKRIIHRLWMPRDTIYIGIREDFYFYVAEGALGSRPPNPNAPYPKKLQYILYIPGF
jgi:hypothetical protein